MQPLNSLIVEGNVVHSNREKDVFKFAIAANRSFTNAVGEVKNEVSYFDVEAYGKLADICEKKCKQGCGIRIVGRLKQVESRVFIVAEHIEFRPEVKNVDSSRS